MEKAISHNKRTVFMADIKKALSKSNSVNTL